LQLQRYVLEDVREMSALAQPLEKSARLMSRTVMLRERRQCFGKGLVESRDVDRADVLETAELDVAGDDRRKAPLVGAAQCADSRNLQLLRVDQWLCSGTHLVA